jgi:hypothetical protein
VFLRDESSILGVLLLVAASLAVLSAFWFSGMFLCAGIEKKVIERGDKEKTFFGYFLLFCLLSRGFL